MALELEEDPVDPLARRLFDTFADAYAIDMASEPWRLLSEEERGAWRVVAREVERVIVERGGK